MTFLSSRRTYRPLFPGALLAILCAPAWSQEKPTEQGAAAQAKTQLSPRQIPTPPPSLPVLRLTTQKPPTEFIQETLRHMDPKAEKLVPLSQIPEIAGKEGKFPEEFMGGLDTFFGNFFFTNKQYFWAEPFEFNTNEAIFINSVNIADNEVHGDWWLFSTLRNCCDLVDITAIPASEGYGAANHGSLDYWVLHSCEVVPSAMDAPCPSDSRPWWTPWFNVFQGLHTVVGYRTIMWIDDDVTPIDGQRLRTAERLGVQHFRAAARKLPD